MHPLLQSGPSNVENTMLAVTQKEPMLPCTHASLTKVEGKTQRERRLLEQQIPSCHVHLCGAVHRCILRKGLGKPAFIGENLLRTQGVSSAAAYKSVHIMDYQRGFSVACDFQVWAPPPASAALRLKPATYEEHALLAAAWTLLLTTEPPQPKIHRAKFVVFSDMESFYIKVMSLQKEWSGKTQWLVIYRISANCLTGSPAQRAPKSEKMDQGGTTAHFWVI
eukprot:1159727-Pelagomonas_calceolata.AAC.13